MDGQTETMLLDEIFEVAEAYGGPTNTIEPELIGLGVVAGVRTLTWDQVRHLRKGIDRRVLRRNTRAQLQSAVDSAILNTN
jgi:hypothetical protein